MSRQNSCHNHHGTCSFSKTECCWCLDKRSTHTIYLDSYGTIEPEKYGITMPKELYYCSHCKSPDTVSIGAFTELLRDSLPNPSDFFRLKKIDDEITSFLSTVSARRKIGFQDSKHLETLNTRRVNILYDISKRGKSCRTNRLT